MREVERKLAKYRAKLALAEEKGLDGADYELKLKHWTQQQRRLFEIHGEGGKRVNLHYAQNYGEKRALANRPTNHFMHTRGNTICKFTVKNVDNS